MSVAIRAEPRGENFIVVFFQILGGEKTFREVPVRHF